MIHTEIIGKSIRALRKQRKLSQEQLAEALGMYQADISNLERAANGSGIGDLFKLDLIADYFGVPLEELLTGVCMQNAEKSEDPTVQEAADNTEDLYDVNYANLAVVYRYRLMVETDIERPCIYSDIDDTAARERAILKKLKAACASEQAYQVWKQDIVDAKVKEVVEQNRFVVCKYLFAGMGSYEEVMPEDMVDSFICWINGNGSAFYGGNRPATDDEIRAYVSQHIADELLQAAWEGEY